MAVKQATPDNRNYGANRCPHCFNKRNQLARHVHFLQLGDDNAISFHLRDEYGEQAEKDGTINAVIACVSSVRQSLKDTVDQFGRPLPAWEAWLMAQGASTSLIATFRPQIAA